MCEIANCLNAMPRCFGGLDLSSVLTNGKVETHLKTLMGITWVAGQADSQRRSFLMDKQFGADDETETRLAARLDLVAFEGNVAKFWIEAKCDFAADRTSVERSARKALRQVWEYGQALPAELQGCPKYIVHFLCPLPDEDQYPDWVDGFEPLIMGGGEYTGEDLHAYYRAYARDHLPIREIRSVEIDFEPNVSAVIVKC
jgi:hypothetical protein